MTEAARPRRSALYMPGARARALEKARGLPADVVILDLEDAVGPTEKAAARRLTAEALREGGFGRREVVVRINGLDTPWGADDLAAAAAAGPDAILAPKVNSINDLEKLSTALEGSGAPRNLAIWAMIETPQGVISAPEIAAHPRLRCLVMGTNDLVKELGAEHGEGRAEVLPALGWCLLAARARGLAILDGVHNAYRDLDGLRAACRQARALGFDGKTLIHPDQIAVANEVFAPSPADLDLARRQIAAWEETRARGEAVAVVDGRIVENLHVEAARALIARAEAIAAAEAAD